MTKKRNIFILFQYSETNVKLPKFSQDILFYCYCNKFNYMNDLK